MSNVMEIKKRVENAKYEILYASEILKGEVYGDTDYALSRLVEATKQLDIIIHYCAEEV